MREFEPSPELSSPKNTERVIQPLGSTALLFIPPPEVHVDPYETTIFVIEDEDDAEESDATPSFASSREDYQLLRRHKQSMRNRRKRGGR